MTRDGQCYNIIFVIIIITIIIIIYCVKYNNILWKKIDRTKNEKNRMKLCALWTYIIYIKRVGVDEYSYMLCIYYIDEVCVNIHNIYYTYITLNIPDII